jgi:trimethylamine:corrinoid methyltransferase-like protein
MRRPSVRQRRQDAAESDATASQAFGQHAGPTLAYSPLSQQQTETLIDSAIALLAEVGIRMEPGTEADELFRAAGCDVQQDGVVRIPAAQVRRALATMPKRVDVWNRSGQRSICLDKDHTWFIPGMTCIKVFDPSTGVARDSTAADLALIAQISETLPNIDAVCVACKDVPHSDMAGEIGEFACLIRNTSKPLEYLCENAESLEAAITMAAAVRGGLEELRAKPYFLHIITPLPMQFAETHIRQIITAARHGVPTNVGTLAIGGASSPITTAGCIVHCLATDFAAMTLAQLVSPGAFCVGSSDVYFMEPATGGIGSMSQTGLAEMAICQVRRYLGIPSFTGNAGAAKSRRFNQDAVWEISSSMTQTFFTRPATCDYLGTLDQGITFSLHALLLCNDLAGLLRTQWQGIALDGDHLAVDLMREIGPFGSVLGHEHTARHCRTAVWQSSYFGPNEPLATTDRPDMDLLARIDQDLKERLAKAEAPQLSPDLEAKICEILARY